MAHGSFSGTSASAILVAANTYRDNLLIQKTNATVVAIGIGIAAEAGKGVQLVNIGDTLHLRGAEARLAIYVIGNGGTGTYQDGDISFVPGPIAGA